MERVADYIIRKVNEAGAKHIFLITGRGILYLTDAVAKNKEITAVLTYHEQGASFAAMAYADANNGVSACLVSTGCAAANAVTAALCAYQDNLPVVFISGNNQLSENKRHTGMDIRTYGSQETDIISIVEPLTKYAVMLEEADKIVYEVEKALFIARDGRKGPVWIDVPLDVQNMRIEESEQKHFNQGKQLIAHDISSVVDEIADELSKSQRPVLLIGGGAKDAGAEVKQLVEKYKIPLVCSPTASDIYGTAHRLSIGAVGSLGGSRAGNFTVQNGDYLLALGTKLCSQLTGMKDKFAREAKITVVDIDEREHNKNGVVIDRLVVSDAKVFLSALVEHGLACGSSEWTDKTAHWKELFSVSNEAFIKELKDQNKVDLYSMMDELSPVLPDDATVITDAGLEELIVPSSIQFREGQRCLFPAAQGAMGYAVPAIIGAYEAGRRSLVCIVGDGSIMMNLQELEMISALKIPVKIFVINNNMYAVIRKRQTDLFRKRTIGNDPSDGVPAPNFRNIAECFGFSYRLLNNRAELLEMLPSLFSDERESIAEIIEVISVPEQKYFHESYAINENRRLVHRPIEDMSPFLPRELIKQEIIVDMMEE